jgi:Cytochrome P460
VASTLTDGPRGIVFTSRDGNQLESNSLSLAPRYTTAGAQAFFIEKDSRRFPNSRGWGYALFNYDAASDTFTPDAAADNCGHPCHTIVKAKDYIFHPYQKRGRNRRGETACNTDALAVARDLDRKIENLLRSCAD